MTSTRQTIAEQITNLRNLSEGTRRLLAELSPKAPRPIGPPCLRFLEEEFLKPTTKNPKSRKV